jgi:hypothetical protein
MQDRHLLAATRDISVEQQVYIFLFIVSQGAANRTTQERFQHSGETISRNFLKVLHALETLSEDYIQLIEPEEYEDCVTEISQNPKFYPYFKDCIGAIDGSLIPVSVSAAQKESYLCRKGFTAQNVLAVVSFDLTFQFVLAGWEGTAHDGRVLDDALGPEKGFKIPENKYPHHALDESPLFLAAVLCANGFEWYPENLTFQYSHLASLCAPGHFAQGLRVCYFL